MRDSTFMAIIIFVACITIFGGMLLKPVVAAQPAVPPCEAINTAGAITIYRCEPDEGPPYLVNSVGFMEGEE